MPVKYRDSYRSFVQFRPQLLPLVSIRVAPIAPHYDGLKLDCRQADDAIFVLDIEENVSQGAKDPGTPPMEHGWRNACRKPDHHGPRSDCLMISMGFGVHRCEI